MHTLTMLPHLSTFEISRPNPFTSQARPIAARASEACWTNQACFFLGRGGRVLLGDPAKLVESFPCQVCPAIEAGMPQASADLTQNDCVVQKRW